MAESARTTAPVTLTTRADVTSLHAFRQRRKTEDGTIEKDLMATAHFVLVSTDRVNLRPVPIPEQLRSALEPYSEHAN